MKVIAKFEYSSSPNPYAIVPGDACYITKIWTTSEKLDWGVKHNKVLVDFTNAHGEKMTDTLSSFKPKGIISFIKYYYYKISQKT